MPDYSAQCVETTSVDARVRAFPIDASSVSRAIVVNNAFWVSAKAVSACAVWTARVRVARVFV